MNQLNQLCIKLYEYCEINVKIKNIIENINNEISLKTNDQFNNN